MLEIKNANKSFGPKDLFRHFTATAATGRITALTGISGSGKSTLLNCIGGLDTLDSGSIEFAGTAITGLSKSKLRALRRNTIGYLFQDYALIPEQTVRSRGCALSTQPSPREASKVMRLGKYTHYPVVNSSASLLPGCCYAPPRSFLPTNPPAL